jgi:acyl-CoA thioesterase 8
MMVTLNYTMYFHDPQKFKADEWILSELQSYWADNRQGLVQQKIWGYNGKLIATCIQEVREIGY